MERTRPEAGQLAGMADVTDQMVSKVIPVSPSEVVDSRSPYLGLASCHPAGTVSCAINLAASQLVSRTVAHDSVGAPVDSGPLTTEHPAAL